MDDKLDGQNSFRSSTSGSITRRAQKMHEQTPSADGQITSQSFRKPHRHYFYNSQMEHCNIPRNRWKNLMIYFYNRLRSIRIEALCNRWKNAVQSRLRHNNRIEHRNNYANRLRTYLGDWIGSLVPTNRPRRHLSNSAKDVP